MQANFSFSLQAESPSSSRFKARAGRLTTAHSTALTPIFMPVGTNAIVRGQFSQRVADIGFPILLANTYHLLLRPGPDVFKRFGGIQRFMNWPASILTDSGGFQVFSLSQQMSISEQGARFRSYVDGKQIMLTPEISIATQEAIGSDIMMVLDHCVPSLADRHIAEEAVHLTHRWAKRCLNARTGTGQALFGIVQGACFPDLRALSAAQITTLPFEGFAIGGVAVGDDRNQRDDIISHTSALLPTDKPRYLMGVGTPSDLLEAVARGIDMFDCILPTALAQQGVCFTTHGKIDLRRGAYKYSEAPLDVTCSCSTCRSHSRAYLHHLIKAKESMGGILIGVHNLTYYFNLMQGIRAAIVEGSFDSFYDQTKGSWQEGVEPRVRRVNSLRSSRPALTRGVHEVISRDNFHSVKHLPSGEVMHSVVGPFEEAERLYVSQSRLRERIVEQPDRSIVIWDVGLGAATNAMAAVLAIEAVSDHSRSVAPVEIVSFENDLDSLRLVTSLPGHFPQARHPAPHLLLRDQRWSSRRAGLVWKLQEGDFLSTLEDAPQPDIVFYDPFSFKTNGDLWKLDCFIKIFNRSKPGTTLFTYSASTAVRATLLVAGFSVGKGLGTGLKRETTVAFLADPEQPVPFEPLTQSWLERWERSDAMVPEAIATERQEWFKDKVRGHPQFNLARH